jgi:hypothetical protein
MFLDTDVDITQSSRPTAQKHCYAGTHVEGRGHVLKAPAVYGTPTEAIIGF